MYGQHQDGFSSTTDSTASDKEKDFCAIETVHLQGKKIGLLLRYLGFQKFVREHHSNYSVEFDIDHDKNTLVFTCSGVPEDCVDWNEIVDRFISALRSKEIHCSDKLLFDKNDLPNQPVYDYITSCLPDASRDKLFVFCREGKYVRLYAHDDRTLLHVKNIVDQNIKLLSQVQLSAKLNKALLEKLSNTGKLSFKPSASGSYVDITGTLDVLQNLDLPERILSIQIPDLILKFLRNYGKDVCDDFKTKEGLEICLSQSSVVLLGTPEKLKNGKKCFKNLVVSLRRSIPVHVSEKILDSLKEDLNQLTESEKCSWKKQAVVKPIKMLPNCIYVTDWVDFVRDTKISVVRGTPWDLDTDLQIVFLTDNLVPLEYDETMATKNAVQKFLETVKKETSKFNIGDATDVLTDVKDLGDHHSNHVVGLVVCSAAGGKGRPSSINKKDLETAVLKVFNKMEDKPVRTVCVAGWFIEKSVDKKFLKRFLDYVIDIIEEGKYPLSELIVCAFETSDIDLDEMADELKNRHGVLGVMADVFKNRHGYCKIVHTADGQPSMTEDSNGRISVRTSPLQEERADVLVNTTNKDLNLSKGYLSRSLLKLAGNGLQDECKRKYPEGIKTGEIAVTSAHELHKRNWKGGYCKYIYHVALPPYNADIYMETIKTYVKKCLCQAERDNCQKIAFPAFGVGNLAYPFREVAYAMLTAAEEYCKQAVNLRLRKIKFNVLAEDLASKAFSDEEWRRSKKYENDTKQTKPNIVKDFRALALNCGHISIDVTTETDASDLLSYVVRCYFNSVDDSCTMKRASEGEQTWNDCLYLGKVKDIDEITTCLKRAHNTFKQERITVAAVHTLNDHSGKMCVADQVETIVKHFETTTDLSKLKKVIILVASDKELQQVSESMKIGYTIATHSQKAEHTIELVGRAEALDRVEPRIKNMLYKASDGTSNARMGIQKSSSEKSHQLSEATGAEAYGESAGFAAARDTRVKSSGTDKVVGDTFDRTYHPSGDKEIDTEKPSTDDDIFLDNGDIKAQLNPGFVKINKDSSAWKPWIKHVEARYNVKIGVDNDDESVYYVQGSLDDIIEFEDYLSSQVHGETSV